MCVWPGWEQNANDRQVIKLNEQVSLHTHGALSTARGAGGGLISGGMPFQQHSLWPGCAVWPNSCAL